MSVLSLDAHELKAAHSIEWSPATEPEGFVIVYEQPEPDRLYVVGGDCAYGLESGDRDVFFVLDKTAEAETGRVREVGIAVGRWGERADRILYSMHRYWAQAFLCVERQVGMFALRRLWDDYGVRNIYRPRAEEKVTRRIKDMLGHPRSARDMVMWRIREAILHDRIDIRSIFVLDEMRQIVWSDAKRKTRGERSPDEDLKIKLVGGGSPDQTMALAYAWLGCGEVYRYEQPEQRYAKGTLGDILGHNETLEREGRPASGTTWLSPRMRRRRMRSRD